MTAAGATCYYGCPKATGHSFWRGMPVGTSSCTKRCGLLRTAVAAPATSSSIAVALAAARHSNVSWSHTAAVAAATKQEHGHQSRAVAVAVAEAVAVAVAVLAAAGGAASASRSSSLCSLCGHASSVQLVAAACNAQPQRHTPYLQRLMAWQLA
jgi:hypothetical protein